MTTSKDHPAVRKIDLIRRKAEVREDAAWINASDGTTTRTNRPAVPNYLLTITPTPDPRDPLGDQRLRCCLKWILRAHGPRYIHVEHTDSS